MGRWAGPSWPFGDPARDNKRQTAQDSQAGLVGRVWGTWGVVAGVGPLNRQGGGDTASDSSNTSLLHPSCVPGIMLSQAAPTPHLKEPGITMSTPLGRALRLRGDKTHVQGHKASVDMLGLESRFSHSIPPPSPWGPGTGPYRQVKTRVGPRHAGQSQILTLELANSAGSLTLGAGQANVQLPPRPGTP